MYARIRKEFTTKTCGLCGKQMACFYQTLPACLYLKIIIFRTKMTYTIRWLKVFLYLCKRKRKLLL